MDKKVKFLKSLFNLKKDILVLQNFHPMLRGFYDCLEKMEMEKAEYESFVKGLYKEGLITIDLHGYNDLQYATIWPTKEAAEYIANQEGKQKIGFDC